MISGPTTNGGNGRDGKGQFAAGNKGGPGNPQLKRQFEFKRAMLNAITPEDLTGIIRSMVAAAQRGDVQAAKLILDRLLGPQPLLVQVESEGRTMHVHALMDVSSDELRDAIRRLPCDKS